MKGILLFLLCIGTLLKAQIPVLDLNQDTLFFLEDENIQNAQHQVIFKTKGNIVFNQNSSSFKDILFTLALDSLPQKKSAIIYNEKGALSLFSIRSSYVYYKLGSTEQPVAFIAKTADSWAIYSALNDSLLAYIPTLNVSNSTLFAIYYALWNQLEIEKSLKAKSSSNSSSDYAWIEPVFGNQIVWIWDGKYLYPNGANMNHPMVWIYENDKLYPKNYPRTQEEWAWDGSSLKPYWGGNPQAQWTWQNGVLRQIWNNNYQNEYFIDDNVIRKRFGSFGDNEWEIHGDVPLPIITAIVLRVLNR